MTVPTRFWLTYCPIGFPLRGLSGIVSGGQIERIALADGKASKSVYHIHFEHDAQQGPMEVNQTFIDAMNPRRGGYIVYNAKGHISYVPQNEFEKHYQQVQETADTSEQATSETATT